MQKSIIFLYSSKKICGNSPPKQHCISYIPSIHIYLPIINEIVSFCISRGTYDILVTKDNQTRSVGQYDNHGSFGELALMYNTPRAATIVATSEGSLWGLVS